MADGTLKLDDIVLACKALEQLGQQNDKKARAEGASGARKESSRWCELYDWEGLEANAVIAALVKRFSRKKWGVYDSKGIQELNNAMQHLAGSGRMHAALGGERFELEPEPIGGWPTYRVRGRFVKKG